MKKLLTLAALAPLLALAAIKDIDGNPVTTSTSFGNVDGETGTVGEFLALQPGEPAQYLKDASVSDNTLTITKKDGTTVEFAGGGTGTVTDVQTNGVTAVSNGVANIVFPKGGHTDAEIAEIATNADAEAHWNAALGFLKEHQTLEPSTNYTDRATNALDTALRADLQPKGEYLTAESDPTVGLTNELDMVYKLYADGKEVYLPNPSTDNPGYAAGADVANNAANANWANSSTYTTKLTFDETTAESDYFAWGAKDPTTEQFARIKYVRTGAADKWVAYLSDLPGNYAAVSNAAMTAVTRSTYLSPTGSITLATAADIVAVSKNEAGTIASNLFDEATHTLTITNGDDVITYDGTATTSFAIAAGTDGAAVSNIVVSMFSTNTEWVIDQGDLTLKDGGTNLWKWSAQPLRVTTTNAVEYHYGTTVTYIPMASGDDVTQLTFSTNNWPDTAAVFAIFDPQGAFEVDTNKVVFLSDEIPTYRFEAAVWRVGAQMRVNPISDEDTIPALTDAERANRED